MRTFIFLLNIFILNLSCQEQQTFSIKEFRQFISEIENNYKYFTEVEWAMNDEKLEKFDTEFYNVRNILSYEEVKEVNELFGKYEALKLKWKLSNIKNDIIDVLHTSRGFIEEIMSDSNDIQDGIEEGRREIKSLLHDSPSK